MNYTAHSLFSGIGGLDLGAVYAGFEIKTQIENDPYAVSVLEKHAPKFWNNATVLNDIREVRPEQIGYADLIFGGFPCQDLSYSGQQKGIRGEKSGLFFEAVRLIRDLRPRAVLLENVLGIERNGLREVLHTLSKSGYSATWTYVRASQLGATQRRERWFCVAIPERQYKRYSMEYAISSRLKSRSRDNEPRDNASKTSDKLAFQNSESMENERRNKTIGTDNKRGLVRDANGFSEWLDFNGFPATPEKEQYEWEPPRVKPTYLQTQKVRRIHALGNAVIPHQALPFFLGIREFLEWEDEQCKT